ncbi:MAG: hypothetical protein ACRDM7_23980 [Thermoleophilaceae bacterium]
MDGSIAQEPGAATPDRTFMQRLLDGVERVGNKMPHPAILFLSASA